eukprot:1237470-Rhodomonas_salina.2
MCAAIRRNCTAIRQNCTAIRLNWTARALKAFDRTAARSNENGLICTASARKAFDLTCITPCCSMRWYASTWGRTPCYYSRTRHYNSRVRPLFVTTGTFAHCATSSTHQQEHGVTPQKHSGTTEHGVGN